MSVETHPIGEAISEDTSYRWRGRLIDADGVAIPTGSINSIVGSLLDGDGAVVNGRNNQNLLGANGGSVSNDGTNTWFTMQFGAADAETPGVEKFHKRFFNIHIIYNAGELEHQVQLYIVNHVYV